MKAKNSGKFLLKFRKKIRPILSLTLATGLSGVLSIPLVWAKVGTAPGGIDANSLDAASQDCDSFCTKLMGYDTNKWDMDSTQGVTSKSNSGALSVNAASKSEFKMRWTPADDQWCADHGSPTDESVSARTPVVTPSPSASPFKAQSCPYPTYPGEDCLAVKDRLLRCKLRHSQVETQCGAYMKAKQGLNWQWTMVVLDTTAAGICLGECYLNSSTGPAMKNGTPPGITPLPPNPNPGQQQQQQQQQQQDSPAQGSLNPLPVHPERGTPVSFPWSVLLALSDRQLDWLLKNAHAVQGVALACGIAAGVASGTELVGVMKMQSDSTLKKILSGGLSGVGAGSAVLTAKGATSGNNTTAGVKDSCITGYIMAAMAAARGYSIYDTTDTMDQACKQVQDLASEAASALGGQPDTGLGGANASNTSILPTGASTTGNGTSTGATQGSSGTSSALTSSPDLANGYSTATQQAATDASLLNRSGLDRVAMPKAQQIDPNKLMSALMNNGPSAAVQSGLADLGVRLPAQAMKTTQAVLNETERYAKAGKFGKPGSNTQVAGSAYRDTGAGGSGSGEQQPTQELAGFDVFGGSQGGTMGNGSEEINLTPQTFGPDIWHTHSKLNLFQIVSEKIDQVGYRVR